MSMDISANEIFDDEVVETFDEIEEGKSPQKVELAAEPLFSALLRRSAKKIWGDNAVIQDFVRWVAGPLSAQFGHVTAKGGDFVLQQLQEGKGESAVERYRPDQ